MRLVSFVSNESEKIGLLIDDQSVLDLTAAYTLYLSRVERKGNASAIAGERFGTELALLGGASLRIAETCLTYAIEQKWNARVEDELGRRVIHAGAEVKLSAPVRKPLKLIDVGANTQETRQASGPAAGSRVEYVWWFLKDSRTVIGPGDMIIHPGTRVTKQLVSENELAVVMGKACGPGVAEVSQEDVDEYVAGYTIFNDVTALDVARPSANARDALYNLARSKNYPTFSPIGPCLVTANQLADVDGLEVVTRVNGQVRQQANTSQLLRSPRELVHHLSTCTVLAPGDVIGCGAFHGLPTIWPGDAIELEIAKIGILRNNVGEAADPSQERK